MRTGTQSACHTRPATLSFTQRQPQPPSSQRSSRPLPLQPLQLAPTPADINNKDYDQEEEMDDEFEVSLERELGEDVEQVDGPHHRGRAQQPVQRENRYIY